MVRYRTAPLPCGAVSELRQSRPSRGACQLLPSTEGLVRLSRVKNEIRKIGIKKCARESGFDRKNFIRKLVRGIPVKRNSYNEFLRWLKGAMQKFRGEESSQ
jgi:hypothetical protein